MFEDPPTLQAMTIRISENLEVWDNQKDSGTEPGQKPLISKIEELVDQKKKDKFVQIFFVNWKKDD